MPKTKWKILNQGSKDGKKKQIEVTVIKHTFEHAQDTIKI